MRAIETPRFKRLARIAATILWWSVLAIFVRSVIRTRDAAPEHLLALVVLGYLAGWGPFLLFSRLSPAGKSFRLAICTASVVLAFGMIETPAALRLVDYRSVFHTPTPPWRRTGNRPDPDLIYVREPNQRLRVRFQGSDLHRLQGASASSKVYRCDTRLDGGGFRNPADLHSAQVVMIGDSFVEGLQAADDELISAQLAKALGVSTANLGRTGYGPQQELEVLRRYGLPLGPRTCVWLFYEGNDLQDVEAYDASRDRVRKLRPESLTRDWFGRSFVRNGAAYLIRQGAPEPTIPARQRAGDFRDASGRTTEIYFSCGVHEGDAERTAGRCESSALKRFQSIVAEAGALCRARGIDLVVAFVPAKFRVYRDHCRFDTDSPCRDWPVDDLPNAVERAVHAIADDVGFLDLTPAFQARAAEGELVYLADDTHWSAEGHRVAAIAVSECLRRREAARTALAETERD
jgi:SGNH hydrolase-like domain, acetyltransferase AlgX